MLNLMKVLVNTMWPSIYHPSNMNGFTSNNEFDKKNIKNKQ
jgi:hypothetical protein